MGALKADALTVPVAREALEDVDDGSAEPIPAAMAVLALIDRGAVTSLEQVRTLIDEILDRDLRRTEVVPVRGAHTADDDEALSASGGPADTSPQAHENHSSRGVEVINIPGELLSGGALPAHPQSTPRRRRGPRPDIDKQLALLDARVEAGEGRDAIAQELGISPTTLWRKLCAFRRSRGLPPRSPGRPRRLARPPSALR